MIKLLAGLCSVALGVLAFWLAAWGENAAFDVMPLQVICALGALGLGVWTLWSSAAPYPGRGLALGAAVLGAAIGGLWLLMIGALWLLWPH